MVYEGGAVVLFTVLAFWQKDDLAFRILAGTMVFFIGLDWLTTYLIIGIVLMATGSYFWGTVIMALMADPKALIRNKKD